jgi:hypothetical protein
MNSESTFISTEKKGKTHGNYSTQKGSLPSRKAQNLESTFSRASETKNSHTKILFIGGI